MKQLRIKAPAVAVDQVWQNVRNNCQLTVLALPKDGKVLCRDQRGRELLINVDSFRPTSRGYRLVSPLPPTPAMIHTDPDDI